MGRRGLSRRVELYPVPDTATRIDMLLRASSTGCRPPIRTDRALERPTGSRTSRRPAGTVRHDQLRGPPFDDIHARQALAYATPSPDYLRVDRARRGASVPPTTLIPDDPYYNPDVMQVADDPDTAIALVSEYCAERGRRRNPYSVSRLAPTARSTSSCGWSRSVGVQTRRPRDLIVGMGRGRFNVTLDELPRTITSRRRHSACTTSTRGASSAPMTRQPTMCGCCAARSVVSR